MILSTEIIDMAKKDVAIEQYFVEAESVRANHLLYQDFIEMTKWKGLPKAIFYILMNYAFQPPVFKDANGCLGYKLKVKQDGT